MEVTVQKLPKSEVKLVIALSEDDLTKYREMAAESVSKRVSVPGFREGKAPAFMVEGQVGKEAFFQEVLRFALPATFSDAVKKENLPLIAKPRITIVSDFPLKYEALSALLPEIKLKNYKKAKVAGISEEITEKEINDVIYEMQKIHAKHEIREGQAEKGDRVEIDFQGYDEGGAHVDSTKSQQHPLYIGEGTLIPGFEEELVGMKVSDKKKFPLKIAKDFRHKPLQGKTIHFEVEMKKIEKVILPELDEAFIERLMGQKASAEAFRSQVASDLKVQKRREGRQNQENQLIEEWLKSLEVEIPPVLIDEEIDYLVDELQHEIEQKGLKWDQFMEYMKQQKRDIREERRAEAEKRIRIRLMLNEILKLENIITSDEEVEKVIEGIIRSYPEAEHEKARQYFKNDRSQKAQIINSLRLTKLFDLFLKSSVPA